MPEVHGLGIRRGECWLVCRIVKKVSSHYIFKHKEVFYIQNKK